MPRRKRNYLPDLPYHLVQRGNNRCTCFHEEGDYRRYLELWRTKAQWYGVAVHAYCLMTNHIHFLASSPTPNAISDTMRTVGSQYAYYINSKYDRTGTLWEGRHRSSLVDADNYLLICQRYIELNPVRAKNGRAPCGLRMVLLSRECLGRPVLGVAPRRVFGSRALVTAATGNLSRVIRKRTCRKSLAAYPHRGALFATDR
ncbi:MAG: transposase [Gammaproteobacteria bacterium]|nr:transposase [Gammaproteobacteria bacterium]